VILYGYSAGGKQVLEICQRLEFSSNRLRNQQGRPLIVVDLLVTVDAAAKRQTFSRVVHGCVRQNLNFFQTKASLNGSHGDVNTALTSAFNGNTPVLVAVPMDGEFAGIADRNRHGLMQDRAHPRAMDAIKPERDRK